MRITKVYTRTGDDGTTQLVGGEGVRKDHPRIEAYGTVDELNAILGLIRAFLPDALPQTAQDRLDGLVAQIQDDLFNVGTELATPEAARWEGLYRIGDPDVERLEATIDDLNRDLDPLEEFILPGGGRIGALLHQGRTVCRRAERRTLVLLGEQPELGPGALRYLNRLSDLLFVAARWAALQGRHPEVLWRNPSRRR